MIYSCCDPRRRELVLEHPTLNGLDSLEVLDAGAPDTTPRQRTLLLRFLKPAPVLTLDNIEIVGGERIQDVGIEWITSAAAPDLTLIDPIEVELPGLLTSLPDADHVLALRTDSTGDHSRYTLRVLAAPNSLSPPAGIDRVLAEIGFSFKVECPADFDCLHTPRCPTPAAEIPALSYLARDYQSFRRLMLDRMSQLAPEWTERNAADLGVTLVEMLAYTGDRLSYAADAASEAYLHTARRRSSVRRHARLVDYEMHDGSNARLWMHIRAAEGVSEAAPADPSIAVDDTRFFTQLVGLDPVVQVGQLDAIVNRRPEFFEPLHDLRLFHAHNTLDFYTWGDEECCLPAGSTRATLDDDYPELSVGDVLVFEERVGPRTGDPADRDPEHRHAVALTAVQAGLTDELTGADITEIRWAEEDALPFALCISSRRAEQLGEELIERVSHALGNIVLADHGRTITEEALGVVPEPHLLYATDNQGDFCEPNDPVPVPPRFRPRLDEAPITQVAPFDPEQLATSAHRAIHVGLAPRRPALFLRGTTPVTTLEWEARRDLLNSRADDTHVVVELERDAVARLRFGNDANGMRPSVGTIFEADYRVGNGVAGNVGRDAVQHVVSLTTDLSSTIEEVRNPLPGRGGVEPESIEAVRRAAPIAWRRQERAVTADDYAEVAKRHPDVQRAEATFRWNGHGHTVFITVDRFGGRPVTAEFETELRDFVERFRMAAYDLEIDAPRFVAIELELFVCAAASHFRSQVKVEVLDVLSSATNLDGTRGFFHPDNSTFGDSVWLSAITARVMEVPGVDAVTPTVFRRRGAPDPIPLLDGVIEVGRLEIAQLSNDPNFPERGSIEIEMGGGK